MPLIERQFTLLKQTFQVVVKVTRALFVRQNKKMYPLMLLENGGSLQSDGRAIQPPQMQPDRFFALQRRNDLSSRGILPEDG